MAGALLDHLTAQAAGGVRLGPLEIPFGDDFVDKMAMKSSLEKIKSTLMDIQRELTVLEER